MLVTETCADKVKGKQQLICPFGTIKYDASDVLCFDEGLYGYEEYSEFIVWNQQEYQPFQWLISLQNPDLMFPVVDPGNFVRDYQPSISEPESWDTLLTIVSIGETRESVTANLRAPILVQRESQKAKQIILTDSKYPLRFQLIQ